MAFVKLDTGLLMSTLWMDLDASRVFITALLLARPKEISQPMPQIEVGSLSKTGFVVPPGKYGFVEAASTGIIRMAGLSNDAGMEALKKLEGPEKDSRTPDFEGRRLVRVDGGFIVLNFQKYRDKDSTNAERQARFRGRHGNASNGVTVTGVTQAEAEAEAEAEVLTETAYVPVAAGKVLEKWNELPAPFGKARLTEKRIRALQTRIKDRHFCENWEKALDRMSKSSFCKGAGSTGWKADLEWFLRPDSVTKIMEGKYDDPDNRPDYQKAGFFNEVDYQADLLARRMK